MVLVMHAGSSTDIPTPVPEAVDKLIVDSGEEFEKGTGEDVPTKGFWFWKHTNPDKIKYWLMKNRNKYLGYALRLNLAACVTSNECRRGSRSPPVVPNGPST